ncbi:hypothetical protein HYS50_01740 [Candidatus Woesearchaeota archaeon]|nr:hypothetical protein [Candidatus Woesearchaeota archaeon]
MSLTGFSFTPLSEEELSTLGGLTIGGCRDVARISAYNDRSDLFPKVADSRPESVLSTLQYQRRSYLQYDLNEDGRVTIQDVNLCYDSVRATGIFSRSPSALHYGATFAPECSLGRRTCRNNQLHECALDSYGVPSWAKVAEAGTGQRCRGNRFIDLFVSKGTRPLISPP